MALVVELHDGEGGGLGGSEGRVLDGDAVGAAVVLVHLGAEKRGEVALQVGEIAVEFEREGFYVGVSGMGEREGGPGGDGDGLPFYVEGNFYRWGFEGLLCVYARRQEG